MLNMKIMNNKSDIQQKAIPLLGQIMDLLIRRAVIKKDQKPAILAKNTPEEKIDTLISHVLNYGENGCISFLSVLTSVGLSDLAEKIKNDEDSSPKPPQSIEERFKKIERTQDKQQSDIDELKRQNVEHTQTIESLKEQNAALKKTNSDLVEELRHFDARFKNVQNQAIKAKDQYERELEVNSTLRATNRRLQEQLDRYRKAPKH